MPLIDSLRLVGVAIAAPPWLRSMIMAGAEQERRACEVSALTALSVQEAGELISRYGYSEVRTAVVDGWDYRSDEEPSQYNRKRWAQREFGGI